MDPRQTILKILVVIPLLLLALIGLVAGLISDGCAWLFKKLDPWNR